MERQLEDLGLIQLRAGKSLIDLIDMDRPLGRDGGGVPDRDRPNMDHLCLLLEDWDEPAIREHLVAYDISPGEVATRYGATGNGPSIYLEDPEGNLVELKGAA